MKIERLKTYLLSVSAGCLLALPWSASAFTVYDDITPLGSSVPATPVAFEGVVTTAGTPCDLNLEAELLVYGSTVEINVLAGNVTGAPLCSTIVLQNFPWTSTTATTAFPSTFWAIDKVPMTFHNVSITPCGTGSAALLYDNWNPVEVGTIEYRFSTIEFSNSIVGLCSLNGVLKMQGTDYNLVNH
ncbi:hypothetical protein [Alloalcanivorax sp.]|jgi:hypothetical protein|uniref:hypothetical protein n=1 Tax=Alloalcanivorax sp. TaxID=3020835 RepID=UPI002EA581AB|nr:hypothetical protein [Pseudomonadota bacterium]